MLAVLPILPQKSLNDIIHPSRLQDGQQWIFRAVSVPEGEGGVVLETFRRMILFIHAAIGSVGVIEQHRRQATQIQIGVKRSANVRIERFHVHRIENFLPLCHGAGTNALEVPPRNLGRQVLARAIDAGAGEAHFDQDRFLGRGGIIEGRLHALARAGANVRAQTVAVALQHHRGERLGKLHHKIDRAPATPSFGDASAADSRGVLHVD